MVGALHDHYVNKYYWKRLMVKNRLEKVKMADTVYEYPNDEAERGYLGFTRFWKQGENWIQITLISEDMRNENVHTYASMPYSKFKEAVEAIVSNVNDTEKAWWHDIAISKSKEMNCVDKSEPSK